MDSINEFLQFLDENARLDLKAVAVTHVLCKFWFRNIYIFLLNKIIN